MEEEWRDIPGFPGYQVSNHGNVRSFWKWGHRGVLMEAPRLMTPAPDQGGYLLVTLRRDSKQFVRKVHSLVLTVFVSPKPSPKMVTRHLDSIKTNNHLSNLAWGTASENTQDTIQTGKVGAGPGEQNANSKLTEDQVCEIRRRIAAGEHRPSLAKEFGIKAATIYMIQYRKLWTHI